MTLPKCDTRVHPARLAQNKLLGPRCNVVPWSRVRESLASEANCDVFPFLNAPQPEHATKSSPTCSHCFRACAASEKHCTNHCNTGVDGSAPAAAHIRGTLIGPILPANSLTMFSATTFEVDAPLHFLCPTLPRLMRPQCSQQDAPWIPQHLGTHSHSAQDRTPTHRQPPLELVEWVPRTRHQSIKPEPSLETLHSAPFSHCVNETSGPGTPLAPLLNV